MKLFKMTRCRLLLALLICLGAGPSSGQTAITLEANQKILLSGMRLEFGSIDIGGYKTQSFTVTNASLATVTGLTCTLDGADAADFVLSTPTLADLAVGAAVSFSVTYVPELVGKVSASVLHVRSSGGSSFELPLTATGGNLNPTVLVEEIGGSVVTSLSRPLDFGSPMIGQSTSKTFRITNTGTAPLRAVSAARDDPWNYRNFWSIGFYPTYTYQYESGFTVTGDITSVIPPGESRSITVTWKPYETAQKTRNITLSWAIRYPPPPPTNYDLTSAPNLLFAGQAITINPIGLIPSAGPYIPPVRFSIPVTGAAVPYVVTPKPLSGLQYHLGNENSSDQLISNQPGVPPDDPRLGPATYSAPDGSGLLTDTLMRWKPAAMPFSSLTYYNSNLDWRNFAQMQLRLIPITVPDIEATQKLGVTVVKSPRSVLITGTGSAAEALGSRVAVAFTSGTRLSHSDMRLPAGDNVGMELWFKPKSLTGTQCVAFMGATADAGFGLWLTDGVLQGRAGSSFILASTQALAVEEWHHVALILQGGSTKLYVDGVQAGSAANVTLPQTVKALSIGAMHDGSSGYEGQIDELRLFEVPASGFDVTRHLLANALPSASLDQTALDYGHVPPAAITQRTATLANTGPGWLRLLSMELTGDGASDYSVSALGPYNSSTPIQPNATPAPVYPTYNWGFTTVGMLVFDTNSLSAYQGVGTNIAYRVAVAPQTKLEAVITHTASTIGPRPATLRITTNDPVYPVYEIALNANVAAPMPQSKIEVSSDDAWDWGSLLTNGQSNRSYTVRTVGSLPMASFGLEIIGPNAEDITLDPQNNPINNGQVSFSDNGSASIRIDVRPRSAGARYAALRITSDDPVRPEIIIPLYGRSVQAVPEIAVTVHHSGDIRRTPVADGGSAVFKATLSGGHHSSMNCIVHSIGTGTLEGVSANIDGADAADFAIVGELPSTLSSPSIWHFDNRNWINLRFTPSRVGTHTATLHILTNDADESPYDITLTGEGLTPAPIMQVIDRDTVIESGTGFTRMGNAVIGAAPVTQTLRLRNGGTAPLTGITASFSGPNASEFSATLPSPIAAGTTGDVIIAFTPEDIGPRSAVLTLTSNAPNNRTYRMSLGGTGAYGVRSNLSPPAIPGWVGTAMAELPDGSIVMAGYVAAGAGETAPAVPTSRLRIIGKDGSERRQARLQHMTISGIVKSICVQADGSLLLAGDFTRLWGSLRPSNVTTGWMPPPGYDPRPFIDCQGVALILSDTAWMPAQIGDALLTISFSGQSQAYPLAWSTSFTPPTGTFSGRSVVALPDGKVLVGGSGSLGGRANLIRLNANGTIDPTFTLPEPNGPVNALAMQDDGKVIVGGEFTNLGHDKLPNETTASTTIPSTTTPRSGLCRLNADGSDDANFANRGFRQVMSLAVRGDSIAVGGMGPQYTAMIAGPTTHSITPPPSYVEIDQAVARLLGRNGAILATQTVIEPPQAVALQPGNRMLFSSRFLSFNDTITYPDIAMLQPDSAPKEWFGIKITADVMPTSSVEPFLIKYQQLVGASGVPLAINALIAQADGKVLTAGNFTRAKVGLDRRGYRSEGDQRLPQPTPLLPVLDNSSLPAETPLAGFAQLDVDGFYHASPRVTFPGQTSVRSGWYTHYLTTDGLAKIDVRPATLISPTDILTSILTSPWTTIFGVPEYEVGMSIFIDGPDAAAFGRGPVVDPYLTTQSAVFDLHRLASMWLSFTPTHQGKHRAVLNVHQDGIDNDFEIALEGRGPDSMPDQVRLVDANNTLLQSSDQRELGNVPLGSSSKLGLRLFNDADMANSTPFELSLTGPNASEFTVSPAAIDSIPGSTRNGAGLAPIDITFKPTSIGPRWATLNLVTVTRGRSGETRSLPFTITLRGTGAAAPLAFTEQPQDVLVMQGAPFSLRVGFNFNNATDVNWYHQQDSRDRIAKTVTFISRAYPSLGSDSLDFPSADSASAGLYRVEISDTIDQANSLTARVGIVSLLNRQVDLALGQTANIGVSFVGPPTMPGSSAAAYQWFFNGAPLTSASGANLVLANVSALQTGNYTCQISLGTASLVTPPISLSLVEAPQITGITNTAWSVAQAVSSSVVVSQRTQQFSAQGLPPGVRLNTSTGQLNGRPTKAGTYNLRITARNAAGISRPFASRVVVLPLPEDVFGSFFGNIYRNPEFNDGLGGTWSLTVTTTGAYSAKLNLATSELSRKKKGKMKTLTLSGIILPKGDLAETMPVSLPHPTGGAALQVSFRLTAKTVVNGEDQHTAAILFLKENHRDQSNGAAFGREKTPRAAVGRFSSGSDQKLDLWVSPSGASIWTAKIQTDSGPHTVTGSAPFITWGPSLFLHQILPHPTQPSSIVGLVQWFGIDTWSGETDLRRPEAVTTEETNGILIPRDSIQAKRVKPPAPALPTLGPAPKRF